MSIFSGFVTDAFKTAKNLVTSFAQPKPTTPPITQPAPTTQPQIGRPNPFNQRLTQPQSMQTGFSGFGGNVVSSNQVKTQPIQTGGAQKYTQQDVADITSNNMTTDNLNVQPRPKISAGALAPENTMSSLMQTRKSMEDRLRGYVQTPGMGQQIADIGIEDAKAREYYDKKIEDLSKNPEGKLSANLNAELSSLKEKKNQQLAYIALRKSAILEGAKFDQSQQNDLIDNITKISKLTNADIVGSLQTDDVTGEVSGFFRDPQTGQITQEIVGKTSPTKNLTYEKVNEQLVAIDKNTGEIVTTYGGGAGGFNQGFADEIDAYARQYAATGQKPTGLPEGVSFGMIAQRAKALPKFNGAIVNRQTGVQPSGVPAEYTSALVTTANLVQKTLPKLLEVYPKLITGGKFNPFTTKNRVEYNSYVQAFLTDLLKAKSGQAVTEQEYNRYLALIPKNLNQLTGEGIKKLNALQDLMTNELNTKLDSKDLAIYGYSKVNVDGQPFTVGDKLDMNGIKFTVMPDGTLSREEDFNSAGNASASNVPQRNNNPGNIKSGGLADKYATGVDSQGHLVFPSADVGFRAMQEDIAAKVSGRSQYLPANPTLAQLGKVYAEDPRWANSVAQILGVNPNTPTQQIPLQALTQAIARQEGFYA